MSKRIRMDRGIQRSQVNRGNHQNRRQAKPAIVRTPDMGPILRVPK